MSTPSPISGHSVRLRCSCCGAGLELAACKCVILQGDFVLRSGERTSTYTDRANCPIHHKPHGEEQEAPPSMTPADDFPIRRQSANGEPKPGTTIERVCAVCGASFLLLAPGKTGERGRWAFWKWYCSQECYDKAAHHDHL
jgi:hypothetical protein